MLKFDLHKSNKQTATYALLLPGFLDSKNHSHILGHQDFLLQLGFNVVTFDPSGTWSNAENNFFSVTNYLLDVIDICNQLQVNKPTSILLIGHSLGGFVAILAAEQRPDISALVAIQSPDQIPGNPKMRKLIPLWLQQGSHTFHSTADKNHKRISLKLTSEFLADAEQYDVLNAVSNLDRPKLFIAGAKDDVVTPEVVQKLHTQAAPPKKFYSLPQLDHDYRLHAEHINKVNQVIKEFLQEFSLCQDLSS